MKTKIILSFLILFLLISFNLNAENNDFRNVNWGMSQDEVREMEGVPDYKASNLLVYDVSLFGIDMGLWYHFYDDKLARASYMSRERYIGNFNKHLSNYNTLLSNLKDKYGNPNKQNKIYQNEVYKNQGDELNLQLGYLTMFSSWEGEKVSIDHFLENSGEIDENYMAIIDHVIIYESNEYKYLIDEAKEQEIQDNL